MTLAELELQMSHLWAKSGPDSGVPGTTLFRHSLDVTQQMAEYYRLYEPEWPLPEEPVCLSRILAYAALMHDFGKIHTDFQAALRPGGRRFLNRHEVLSLVFLEHLEIPEKERPWLEAAVALHHKNLTNLVGPSQPFFIGQQFGTNVSQAHHLASGIKPQDANLLYEFLSHSSEVFRQTGWIGFPCYNLCPVHVVDVVECIRRALGRVVELAKRFELELDDWGNILGLPPWPARRAGVQIRGFILNADHLASFEPHTLHVGLEKVSDVRAAVSATVPKLNSHQCKAAEQIGSAILVAPTGTGKTEAGLLWAARQAEASGLRGRAYVLLPYQASMNAMQARLVEAFTPQFRDEPSKRESEVALVHGRSMRAAYEKLLEREYSPIEAVRQARLQSDLARLNVAPLRVCSPYQVARLLFAPRGVEGLLLSLAQSRLVFDEIHAYDPEVTALALTATRVLTEHFGARALFMTATLPSHLREMLVSFFGSVSLLLPDDDMLNRSPRHRLRLLPYDVLSRYALAEIKQAAQTGSVLVVVNQVQRAIALYRNLKGVISDLHLLHSRFTNRDRFVKEQQIEALAGKVLIATQAVEVSLDLDYDVCFSELAPLESLLQRFGRCNRYGLQPSPAQVSVFGEFPNRNAASCLPYKENHLKATLAALERWVVTIDKGVLAEYRFQEMLDASYPVQMRQALTNEIRTKWQELQKNFVDPFVPFGAIDATHASRLAEQWEMLFDGQEVLPESLSPQAKQEASWLARSRYLVPISSQRFRVLTRQGKVKWDENLMCHVVQAPYNTEEGLEV